MPPVSKYLNLTLHKVKHQLRGSCPTCQNDDIRILAITPAKNGGVFFCHHPQIGGSCIDLVAHILALPLPEAGQWLEDTLPSTVSAQPQRPQPQPQQTEPSKGFDPDEFGAKLAYGEQVEALGLSEEAAKLHPCRHTSSEALHPGMSARRDARWFRRVRRRKTEAARQVATTFQGGQAQTPRLTRGFS